MLKGSARPWILTATTRDQRYMQQMRYAEEHHFALHIGTLCANGWLNAPEMQLLQMGSDRAPA